MAINTVAKAFIPEVFDAVILRTLEDNLVLKQICRSVPNKAATGKGDTIHFPGLADPSIGSSSASFTYEALNDASMSLLIDNEAIFSFKVADLDAIMSGVDLKGSQAERAAYMVKRSIETTVLQNVVSAATAGTVTDTTCDTSTILGDLGLLSQYLQQNNVSENDMWMIIPPWVRLKLQLAGIKFSINEGVNGKGGMYWTQDLGFDIYVTNTVYNSNTVAAPVSEILAGSYQAIGYSDILLPTRNIELEGTRAMGLDGGAAYGYKVLKPNELARATLTYVAESAI